MLQTLVVIGIILNGISTLTYIIQTVRGKVQPNKVTYFLWSIAPLIAFAAQKSQGVEIQSLMTLSVGLFPLSVFIASFLNKKAYWKIKKIDLICGAFSILGLILWSITKIGNLAILFSIIADLLAAIPTMIKSYNHPETEIGWPWLLSFVSGITTLISIRNWQFEYYAFPLYYSLGVFVLFVLIQFKIGDKISKLKNKKTLT